MKLKKDYNKMKLKVKNRVREHETLVIINLLVV